MSLAQSNLWYSVNNPVGSRLDNFMILSWDPAVAVTVMTTVDYCVRIHNGIHTKDEEEYTVSGEKCESPPRHSDTFYYALNRRR
jgi:hypothetical protein